MTDSVDIKIISMRESIERQNMEIENINTSLNSIRDYIRDNLDEKTIMKEYGTRKNIAISLGALVFLAVFFQKI